MRQKLLKKHSNGHQLSKVFMRGHFKLILNSYLLTKPFAVSSTPPIVFYIFK